MKFGLTPIEEAEGAVLAHGVRIDGAAFKKGDILTHERRLALGSAGVKCVVAARLESGDIGENEAALELANRLAGPHLRCSPPFTGRVNLFAEIAGLTIVEAEAIDQVNAVDEAITVATLPRYRAVADGDMVATVKIIPFATRAPTLETALAAAPTGAIAVQPFKPMRIGVVSTTLPGLKPSIVAKTLRVLEARLKPTGARIVAQEIVPHEVGPLAKALGRLIDASDALIAFGASAITDRRDVIPAAIEAIGGTHRTIWHAGRSRQSAAAGRTPWDPDHRGAGLRPVAERERLRLGAATPAGGRSHPRRGHPRDGRRRPAHGDRFAPPAARAR